MIETDIFRGTSRNIPATPRAAFPMSSPLYLGLHDLEIRMDSFRGGFFAIIACFVSSDKSTPLLAGLDFRSGLVTNTGIANLAGSDSHRCAAMELARPEGEFV